ncbi:hypothetical protein [Polynucleobacter sp. JS-JIR-5-A7]|uniref:hypothetical protein n=1 Tax=Polynucleobacter sp. JS-JIR-5-A7 TaxID=1758395 RepID=UPI001BFE1CA6|nr:hypothetical protein [Polynucleobacter sp. JS-JIR-5-A7]QWE06059.1 hypothetical protein AOC29_08030 [Polynucleobacter sp. JS-JIR-5-A7]
MLANSKVTYTVFPSAKSYLGREYTTSWQEMAKFISRHKTYANKQDAQLIQLSSTQVIEKANGKTGELYKTMRGYDAMKSVTAIGLDVDNNDSKVPYKSLGDVKAILKELNLAYVLYTSFSHSSDHHKMRIVIPLSRPIAKHEKDLYEVIWSRLNSKFDFALDGSCCDMARIFYIASHAEDAKAYTSEINLNGNAINVSKFEPLAEDLRFQREETERLRKYNSQINPSQNGSIDVFNERMDIRVMLERNDYQCIGDRYLSPQSSSGSAACVVSDNIVFIHHETDLLMHKMIEVAERNDWPRPLGGSWYGRIAISPFDVLHHLECNGDFSKAMRIVKGEVVA